MSGLIYIENPELVAGVSGSGTINRLPLWTGISTLGNSALTQLGTLVGVNVAVPTAGLSLPAGTTAAASLNFATGVAPTAPNAGDLWFDGTYLYLRAGGVNQPLNAPYGTGTQDRLSKWGPGGVGLTDSVIVQDNSLGYMNTRVVTTTDTNVFALDSNAGVGRNFTFRSGGLDRFAMRVTGAEGGSDAGGDWSLRRYSDAGASLGQALTAVRADGRVYTESNFGAGTDPGTGSAIFSLTGLVGGTGYTASASGVALTGGSGTGATASIIVSGGAVTWVSLESPGQGYQVGDVLAITGGTGTIQVLSTSKVSRVSGLLSVSGRIGAGTSQPQAGLDSRLGGTVSGWQRPYVSFGGTGYAIATMLAAAGTEDASVSGSATIVGMAALPISSSLNTPLVVGMYAWPSVNNTSGTGSLSVYGQYTRALRTFSGDTNTNVNLLGTFASIGHASGGPASFTSASWTGLRINCFAQVPGSVIDVYGVRNATSNISNATAITTYRAFAEDAFALSGGATIGTYYGLRLAAITGAVTTRWGISQEDALGKSRFYGNLGVGNALDVGAGKVIASLTLTNAGAGATNGTYIEAALTGGTGTGATADIVVAGNVVTTLLLRNPGQGYTAGDTLSTAAIGGAGFVFTVATTASILRSDGTAVAARIGAGTTSPRLSLDAVNGAMITGSASMIETNYYTSYFNSNIGAFIGGTLTPSTIYRGVYVNPLINTTSMALTTAAGLISNPNYTDSTAGSITNLTGLSSLMYRSYPNDLSTGANLTGVQSILGTRAGVGSVTSGSFTFFTGNLFHTVAGHTITTLTWYDTAATTLTGNATTTYLLRGRAFSGAGTITNRWAISQEDPLAKSAFYGNVGVGNALDVGAGKVIASLTLTNAGTGYTNGTYSQVALTTSTGSGSGATADIIVAGGIVTTVVLRNPGQGYAVGDTLSCASIGAGSNFLLTVATTASILRSDGTVVGTRVGAGTTTPIAGVDSGSGLIVQGPTRMILTESLTYTDSRAVFAVFGGNNLIDIDSTGASTLLGVHVTPRLTSATTKTLSGIRITPQLVNTSGATSTFNSGIAVDLTRYYTTDLATNTTLRGIQVNVGTGNSTMAWSQPEVQGVAAIVGVNQNGGTITTTTAIDGRLFTQNTGTITTSYLFRARLFSTGPWAITTHYGLRIEASSLSGGATNPTSYWGVSQEDTAAKNQFLGNVGVGVDPGAGKVIGSLTLTAGGTGYTNGTYSQVALTGGSGTGATADITVSGGAVTVVVLRNPGQGYVVGNVLSCASIGAGANFQATVATVASIARADGQVVAPRIGAGTTTPVAGVHSASGIYNDGVERMFFSLFSGNTSSQLNGILSAPNVASPVTTVLGITSAPRMNTAAGTAQSLTALYGVPQVSGSAAGHAYNSIAVQGISYRSYAADLSTGAFIYGGNFGAGAFGAPGSTTTSGAYGVYAFINHNVSGHTITDAQSVGTNVNVAAGATITTASAFYAAATGAGTITTYYGVRLANVTAPTITNRWGISQEDTLAKNVLAGSTAIGLAAGTAAAAFLELAAGTTASAQIRFRTGVAPSSPAVGDFWFDGTDFRVRNGAGTQVIAYVGGSGAVSGTGTPNFLPIWNGASSLTDSPLSFSGSTLTTAASLTTIDTSVTPGLVWRLQNNGAALTIQGTSGNGTLKLDTNNRYVGIDSPSTPADKLHIAQDGVTGALAFRMQNVTAGVYWQHIVDGSGNWGLAVNGGANAVTVLAANGNVGIGTTSPSFALDINSNIAILGPKVASSGLGGNWRYRDDTATARWLTGILGTAGATAWSLYDLVNSRYVIQADSSGNVGIAQTSPSSFLSGFRNLVIGNASGGSYGLTIVADPAASSGIAFADGTAGTEPYRGFIQYLHASDDLVFATTAQEKVRIESNGRVLFGTTSSSAVARAVFQGTSASASAATDVYLQTGTAAASITNNSNLGVLSFAASGSRGAYMQAEADAGWTVSSYPTRLVFATTPSGTTAQSERLRIDSAGSFLLRQSSNPFVNAVSFNTTLQNSLVLDASGNLGVGTGSPANRIDAQGSGTRVIRCLTTDTSGAAVGVIRAEYLGGGGGVNSSIDMRAGDGYAFITTNTSVPIVFGINGTDIGRFTTTGVLCIGTSSGTAASRLVARTTVGNADQMIASFDNDGATIGATGYRTSIQVSCQNTGAADTAIRLTAKAQGSGGGQTSFVEVGTDAGVDMFFVTKGVQRGYVAANDGSLVMTDNITATAGNITATAGNIVATAGNFVVSTSGKGIDFSATPGTGTSELLDDYEEGVWTPALGTSTVGASFTLTSVDARYTKVGRLVHIQWRIVVSSKTGAPVDVILQGLPFTHDECYVSGLIEAFNLSNTGAATANKFAHVVIWGFPGTTVFNMDLVNIDYVARDVGAQVQATSEFNGSFSYITNS